MKRRDFIRRTLLGALVAIYVPGKPWIVGLPEPEEHVKVAFVFDGKGVGRFYWNGELVSAVAKGFAMPRRSLSLLQATTDADPGPTAAADERSE